MEGADVEINFEESTKTFETDDGYDMVIITPQEFSKNLEPLVDHKNSVGVNTTLKTIETIYKEARQGVYASTGRDRAEKIKLFIHWAKENWNITYVLLVGGKLHQKLRWNMPVRYSNLDDNHGWEDSYISDLYFADIYRYNETTEMYEFEDWDSNGNNTFAEWTSSKNKDILDLDPDVYVGRLACRNRFEVSDVVNKIIAYEAASDFSEWFKNIVLVGGDTIPPAGGGFNGIYEGEIVTNLSASYLASVGFNITRLWLTNENFSGTQDVINAINGGAGFIHMSGHGSPLDWGTHPLDTNDSNLWVNGLGITDIKQLENSDKLPIAIIGGCHNSQFDVGFMNMVVGLLRHPFKYFRWSWEDDCFWKWEWIPRCFDWQLVGEKNGGCIASIGNTGLGYEYPDYRCTLELSGWIEPHFFKVYSETDENNQTLGRIHSQTISDYVSKFDPNYDSDPVVRKTVEEWALFGDPSLKIGGYN